MDLAVVAALISSEGLLTVADCQLEVLLDAARLRGPQYDVPKSVPSLASALKARRGWIVSVSGGVEIDAWSVLRRFEDDAGIAGIRDRASNAVADRWWW